MLRIPLQLALLGILLAPVATGQPDWQAEPQYGTISLETGFTPDPNVIDIFAGGSDENSVEGCNGYINNAAPDVDLNFETDGILPLKIYVRSSADTVILINLPDGAWVCNDDYDGVSAAVLIDDPESGNYNIWVGTFGEGASEPATLYFTELPDVELSSGSDASQRALSLGSGFDPDPSSYEINVGGHDYNPIDGCNGFVHADAPDVTLDFVTDGSLSLFVYAQATGEDDDLTILVGLPDGGYECNDDADGLDPGLMVGEPESGRYAVWVGNLRARARTEPASVATLFFSEVEGPMEGEFTEFDDEIEMEFGGGENISLFTVPTFGSLHLDPGFLPDPETISLRIGGNDAMSVDGPGCAGVINSAAPDVNLVYSAGGEMLTFYAESSADATLLVSLPNGDWLCNDDFHGTNPGVVILDPEEGLYNVWVGAFSEDGSGSEGVLHISESEPTDG